MTTKTIHRGKSRLNLKTGSISESFKTTTARQIKAERFHDEELYKAILSSISDVVFATNRTGEFVYISPNCHTIFGHSAEEIKSLGNVSALLGTDIYTFQQLEETGEISNLEREIEDKSGRRHTLLVNIKQIYLGEFMILFTCRDITYRKKIKQSYNEVNERLIIEQVTLREKNLALKEILGQIENEKEQTKLRINSNIQKIVLPILDSMQNRLNKADLEYIKLLRDSLMDIVSPFVAELEKGFTSLSPRELEICNMIKRGMSCKEIASTLNIAVQTVLKQRKHIRKKLGISRRKINLTTHLRSVKPQQT